ncbi:MAG: ABC transporter permease [Kiloniellales bacterium]|nr:ABC transporter permease [Kiloniellales bacterium]
MRALNRKLLRDLWRLRGQVLAIALVIASGVAVLVMSLTALEALQGTAEAYYERYRFAQVFASVKRAPERLAARIAALPGVQTVETRIVELAILDVEGFAEPVIGALASIPERGEPQLNRLALRQGRFVAPGRPDEVVISETFSDGHGLRPGDHLHAIINGHKRRLDIVGVALSPEYVYSIGPGALMPDDQRFGVLWMGEEALAAAYDLDGAFNDVALSLLRGAAEEDVIDRLDLLLARYGGVGAFGRKDQISNWFVTNELDQLKNLATVLPTIFLSVAAFLTNMVLNRLIATERSEIGLVKAFGYSSLEIGWHYMKLVIAIAGLGVLIGWGIGSWLGHFMTEIYAEQYRFPFIYYRPGPAAYAIAALVSLGAALLGTWGAVRRAVALPPAEAMRPPAPPLYRRGRLGALALRLDQPTRMIFRQIFRWPLRSAMTAAGVALSIAVLVISLHWLDAITHMVQVYFFDAQHQDVTVALTDPQSIEITRDFARMPGVQAVEPARMLSVRFRNGTREKRESISALSSEAWLQPAYDAKGEVVPVPPEGLVLSEKLAELLDVRRGESVTVEVLEGRRPVREVPVAGVVETYIGTAAYMSLDAANRMMHERPSVDLLHLLVDSQQEAALFAELKTLPKVSAVMLREATVDKFYDTLARIMYIFIGFYAVFACTLAFGVAYNSARIALSERGRELATLRVLGMSRLEISYILLGEVAILVFLALPLGCLAGAGLAWLLTDLFETDLYRVPMHIEASTFGYSVLVAIAATVVSAAIVRRRVDRLDLVAVLKTRE